jgi:hypothetical protein
MTKRLLSYHINGVRRHRMWGDAGSRHLVVDDDPDLVLDDIDADIPQPLGQLHILGLVRLVAQL